MYTVRFQLELSGSEKRFLSKSFFYANQMHNQLVRYATNGTICQKKFAN